MRVSIFTATHNPQYLLEAYKSIQPQPYEEWVIFPNGGVQPGDLPEEIRRDPRTKIIQEDASYQIKKTPQGDIKIGSVKKFVCSHCTGDVLVEFDHDDLLIPPGIERVKDAFSDPNVVFAFSGCAEFNNEDMSAREYGSGYGWQYKDFFYNGVQYRQAINPPIDPYHTSIIYYAPNHFRAWRKSTYDEVGGHNDEMSVLDDGDLMCRLYLKGKFYEIEQCCYLYRVYGTNSWLNRNAEIQANALNQRRQYLHDMVSVWARRNGHRMIDLGGRFSRPWGYESVDLKDADVVTDLTKLYPFETDSIGVVRAFDFMEHVADKMHTLREIHRVLMPGGFLLSMTPSTTGPNGESGMGAYQDPTHISYWCKNSFWYVTRQEQAKYIDNAEIRFQPAVLENCYPSDWHRENIIPYVKADLVCMKKDENGQERFRPYGWLEI
jgi:O-antigen biosynthesis protein